MFMITIIFTRHVNVSANSVLLAYVLINKYRLSLTFLFPPSLKINGIKDIKAVLSICSLTSIAGIFRDQKLNLSSHDVLLNRKESYVTYIGNASGMRPAKRSGVTLLKVLFLIKISSRVVTGAHSLNRNQCISH